MLRRTFLVADGRILPDWRPLMSVADVSALPVRGKALLENIGSLRETDVEAALAIAEAHAGRFDYVLAECMDAFLWCCLFRMVGDRTPFIIMPRFNCVHARDAYALLLASQFRGPQDVLFCGSHAASRAFRRFGFRCSPLYLPGIDLQRFRPLNTGRAEIRASLNFDRERELLLYVGRMTDDKHVLELLRTFDIVRRSRDVELVLCFHFPRRAYLDSCRRFAEAMGGVRFIEAPDRSTIIRLYNAADLFVTAAVSVFETFGRAPVEAMACGTVPVVSAYNGFRETVTDHSGFKVPTTSVGLRKSPDVERFAETIIAALDDRPTLERKSRAAIERAQRFGWRRSVRAMLKELEAERSSTVAPPGPDRRLRLDDYAPEVSALWESLEGEPLKDLVTSFLITGKVPVQPPARAVRDYYLSWFADY